MELSEILKELEKRFEYFVILYILKYFKTTINNNCVCWIEKGFYKNVYNHKTCLMDMI